MIKYAFTWKGNTKYYKFPDQQTVSKYVIFLEEMLGIKVQAYRVKE